MKQLNLLFTSLPGCGKSAAITQFALRHDATLYTLIGAYRDPADIAGYPDRVGDTAVLLTPSWVQQLERAHNEGRKSLLFIDELTTCPPAVMNVLLRILQERYVGDRQLPPTTAIIAACNPPEVAANGNSIPPALANRLVHLKWENMSSRDWLDGLRSGWQKAPKTALDCPAVPHMLWGEVSATAESAAIENIAEFITSNPETLHAWPGQEAEQSGPWPSFRSWEMATAALAACYTANIGVSIQTDYLAACVGNAAALQWLRCQNNAYSAEAYLMSPATKPLPDSIDAQLSLINSVVALARIAPTTRMNSVITLLSRFPAAMVHAHIKPLVTYAILKGWQPSKEANALLKVHALTTT